ncbi:hypothetical protein GCM10012280_60240 [Wenjunlia tyrosinilytica]|uniref:Uncharacterized protein n=1 Tax=Wenjunlia tyrosinilytica TaxID=1544741 RepID=A0A917ZWE0_9ACTN|nr:hypothetical protein GCM10012280_60240 [Wenjunlia tyrosinilytica]
MMLVGATALTVALASSPASAEPIPGFTNKVKVGGPKEVYSGQVQFDQTDMRGCKKNAWLIGHAHWYLGKVSKKKIEVRKIKLSYRAGVDSELAGQFMQRGNANTVWSTRWDAGIIKGGGPEKSKTFKINKTVPLDGHATVQFSSNYSVSRTGGPADCGGDGTFVFKLKPVK